MDAKEARKVVGDVESTPAGVERLNRMAQNYQFRYALGYLAALSGPEVQALVEALESSKITAWQIWEMERDRALKTFRDQTGISDQQNKSGESAQGDKA